METSDLNDLDDRVSNYRLDLFNLDELQKNSLGVFTDVLKLCMPALFGNIVSGKDKQASIDDLKMLSELSATIGFDVFTVVLDKFREDEWGDNEEDKVKRIHVVSRLIDCVKFLSEEIDIDCNIDETHKIFLSALSQELSDTITLLEDSFLSLSNTISKERDELLYMRCSNNIQRQVDVCRLMGFNKTVHLLMFVDQFIRDLNRNHEALTIDLIDIILRSVHLPLDIVNNKEDASYLVLVEEMFSKLLLISVSGHAAEELKKSIIKISEKISIPTEYVSVMTPESAIILKRSLMSKKIIFEIEFSLEITREQENKIIDWAQDNGEIIITRSIFQDTLDSKNNTVKMGMLINSTSEEAEIKLTLHDFQKNNFISNYRIFRQN